MRRRTFGVNVQRGLRRREAVFWYGISLIAIAIDYRKLASPIEKLYSIFLRKQDANLNSHQRFGDNRSRISLGMVQGERYQAALRSNRKARLDSRNGTSNPDIQGRLHTSYSRADFTQRHDCRNGIILRVVQRAQTAHVARRQNTERNVLRPSCRERQASNRNATVGKTLDALRETANVLLG